MSERKIVRQIERERRSGRLREREKEGEKEKAGGEREK